MGNMSSISYYYDIISLDTGLRTFYRCWTVEKPKAVVVGIHGFAEHSGRYEHVGRFLASKGYAFYIYDLRGHGKSEAIKGYVDRFEDFLYDTKSFIDYVLNNTSYNRIFLLGHSMGGLIAIYYTGYFKHGIEGLATSGAAVMIKENLLVNSALRVLSLISPKKRIRFTVQLKCLTRDEETIKKYLEDELVFKEPTVKLLLELLKATRKVWEYIPNIKVPILIMHGSEDCIVSCEASKNLYGKLEAKDKTLKIYQGMRHEIFNEIGKEKPLNDLITWLDKHISYMSR